MPLTLIACLTFAQSAAAQPRPAAPALLRRTGPAVLPMPAAPRLPPGRGYARQPRPRFGGPQIFPQRQMGGGGLAGLLAAAFSGLFQSSGPRVTWPMEDSRPIFHDPPVPKTEAQAGCTSCGFNSPVMPQPAPTPALAAISDRLNCASADQDLCNMISGVNQIRRARGLPAYGFDPDCHKAAGVHAMDMAQRGYFSHKSPGGEWHYNRYQRVAGRGVHYSEVQENIFVSGGDSNAQEANESFMKSSGHRENILERNFSTIGVAKARGRCPSGLWGLGGGGYCTYYVQCFSKR